MREFVDICTILGLTFFLIGLLTLSIQLERGLLDS